MRKRLVIDPSLLPTRSPLPTGMIWFLMLDKFNAPGWAWGVIGTIWAILFIAFTISFFCVEEYTDITGMRGKA